MVDDDRSMIQFITEMQADKSARDAIIKRLRPHAIQAHKPPWQVQAVNIDEPMPIFSRVLFAVFAGGYSNL